MAAALATYFGHTAMQVTDLWSFGPVLHDHTQANYSTHGPNIMYVFTASAHV